MDLAHTSRYWTSYCASKTFRLTITIVGAQLGFASSVSQGESSSTSGLWDTLAAVYLPNSAGERHETSRARKTSNPIWDQSFVFGDIDFSEHVRIEVRGVRKIGENPLLASLDFEVHEIMGLGTQGNASEFKLECDNSRIRYGVVQLAFHFDPPVPSDVLVGLEGFSMMEDEWGGAQELSVTREVEHPVYINVAGHFACLLLDDDGPVNMETKMVLDRSPTNATETSGSSNSRGSTLASPFPPDGLSTAANSPDRPDRECNSSSRRSRRRGGNRGLSLSRSAHSESTAEGDKGDKDIGRGGRSGDGGNVRAGERGKRRERGSRASSAGTFVVYPPKLLRVTGDADIGRAASSGSMRVRASRSVIVKPRRTSSAGDSLPSTSQTNGNGATDEASTTKHRSRRSIRSRSRNSGGDPRSDVRNGDGIGGGKSNSSTGSRDEKNGKPSRPRSWTEALLRSPTLGGSLTRALNPGSRRPFRSRAMSDIQGAMESADRVTDTSTVVLNDDESLSDAARGAADSDSAGVSSLHGQLKLEVDEEFVRRAFESP